MDQSRFIRGLLDDPEDPQQPQYVPANDFGPRAYGLLNTLFPDPNVMVGDAIKQYRGGDAVGAFETMLGSIPQTGMFLGRNAKTADLGKLAQAEKMAAEGAPRENIWNDTGWFKGVDGDWRFEIPDNKSLFWGKKDASTVGEALKHDELYQAYPNAADVSFEWLPDVKGRYKGSFQPNDEYPWAGNITVMTPRGATPDAGSTTLHELQHYIQRQENNATGGNTFSLKPGTPAWDIYKERIAAITTPLNHETYSLAAGYDGLAPLKDYKAYVKMAKKPSVMVDRAAQEYAVGEGYRRLAGEVEARTTQKRIDMTADERRARAPWLDYDVPEEKQIVRRATRGLLGQ